MMGRARSWARTPLDTTCERRRRRSRSPEGHHAAARSASGSRGGAETNPGCRDPEVPRTDLLLMRVYCTPPDRSAAGCLACRGCASGVVCDRHRGMAKIGSYCRDCVGRRNRRGCAGATSARGPIFTAGSCRPGRGAESMAVAGYLGSRRWPSTTAAARSMSLRLATRECSRSSSNAESSSIEWRSIRMPLARSISARRPNAPSRS
jgi:hypothetical protein